MIRLIGLLLCLILLNFAALSAFNDVEKWQQAGNKAIAYLKHPDNVLNTQTYLLYSFLDRKFELPKLGKSIDAETIFKPGSPYTVFRRLFDGNYNLHKKDIDSLKNAIDRMTLYAIYCDKFPLAPNYFEVMDTLAKKNGYYLTHALWACRLLEENSCLSTRELAQLKTLKNKLATEIVNMLEAGGFFNDIKIEALAMLYYSGMSHHIKPQWIDRIVEAQRDDGGWFRTIKNTKTNGATTVLALWVLMEALHNETKAVSMMFR